MGYIQEPVYGINGRGIDGTPTHQLRAEGSLQRVVREIINKLLGLANANKMATVLVTGGAGFIGSELVRRILDNGDKVVVLDKLSYSGRRENLAGIIDNDKLIFVEGSITDVRLTWDLIFQHQPNAVLNLAAETHVDRSIDRASDFIETNIDGVQVLLDAALAYWRSLGKAEKDRFRFLQVSTDEVFGSIESGLAAEGSAYRPNSPYAATKAAADHLVRAAHRTHGLPTLISRGCNTYGPRQFPEKLVPLFILRALSGASLPLYGDGQNIREWIHVKDHVEGILAVLSAGVAGQSYNIGGGNSLTNLALAEMLLRNIPATDAGRDGTDIEDRIAFVADRPGHDQRYAMDSSKAVREIGFSTSIPFGEGLAATIEWYVTNTEWWLPITKENYNLQRLGTGTAKVE